MVASGLPNGLSLTRTTSSADGARPGTTRFDVTGTADADPGSYPVTVTVADGAGGAADQVVSFTVTVTKDATTVTYTGDTAKTAPSTGTDVVDVTVSATVADTDATPGTPGGTVAFTDQTTGDALCSAPVVAGAASCTFGADLTGSSRTYQVVATQTSTRFGGASAPTAVVVTVAADTTAPETTITKGPKANALILAGSITFTYSSSEPGSTFTCSYGSVTRACPASGLTLKKQAAGSYDFRVVATDAAGNTDATPAVRRFHVPVDDRALKASKGPWQRKTSTTTFRRTYTQVSKKGSELTYKVTKATSLAIVVSKAPSFGNVDVFLGGKKLRMIVTKGSSKTKAILSVAKFANPTTGLVRIVTRSNATVQIDGLGVRSVIAATPRTGVSRSGIVFH